MFKLLVGIGNPGKKYNNTRHNIGWKALDSFNLINKSELISKKDDYELYQTFYESKELYSLKPMTYVNNSGVPLKKIIKKLNINTNEILIILDDINLLLGVIRLKERGGPGGSKRGGEENKGEGIERMMYNLREYDGERER